MADYTYNEAGVTYNGADVSYNSRLAEFIDWIRRRRRRRN